MDIESLYHSYLVQAENLRERDKGVFHASSSGSCLRKQMYNYNSKDKVKLNTMRDYND